MMRVTQPEHPCSVVQSGGAARQRASDFTPAKAGIQCFEFNKAVEVDSVCGFNDRVAEKES
jgi:hypothetical protein